MMQTLGEFLSPEAGQARRKWLDESLGQFIPPELRGWVGAAAEINPVTNMERAGTAAQRMTAPGISGWDRMAAAGDMATNMGAVLAPVAVASKTGVPAANAIVEALTAASPMKGAVDDFMVDEFGGVGFRAYHGSPHDFDRFSLDKIGTGEGKQAEGYGLYFAENPAVAERYRDVLSAKDGGVGKVYEVNINASPEDFIDFDQPLTGQSPIVQAWFDSRGVSPMFAGEQSGQELMMLERSAMGDKAMAESLKGAGIPGVRYRDAGSQNKGEGSRNYVVFDDKLIEILRKYGLAGAVPMGALLSQPQDPMGSYLEAQ